MITGIQIRMARAGLKWSGQELADKSGVGLSTVKRAEQEDGYPAMRTQNLVAIKDTLNSTGRVTFDGEYGVTVKPE